MTDWVVPMTLVPSLIIGPIIVRRIFPRSTGFGGTTAEGWCGMSPLVWGLALGLTLPAPVILLLPPPPGVHRTLTNDLMLILALTIFVAPMIAWGFERWSWDSIGLKRRNLLGEKKLEWGAITEIAKHGRGFKLKTAGHGSVSVDEFVAGMPLIFDATMRYRPDLAYPTAATTG